jgi:hypothetical protein
LVLSIAVATGFSAAVADGSLAGGNQHHRAVIRSARHARKRCPRRHARARHHARCVAPASSRGLWSRYKQSSSPVNSSLPSISGSAVEGQGLSASAGKWVGTAPIHYAYQWQRSGSNVSGSTGSTYTLTPSDVGHQLTVTVTAANATGSGSATSAPTATVTALTSSGGTGSPPPPPPTTETTTPTPTPPPDGFVAACGTQLCVNGTTFRFDGGNVWPECSPGQGLDAALTAFTGPEVIRTWWLQPFATTHGVRDWTALDYALATAAAHNVRLVVTLENQWSDCNNTGYKTLSWYQSGYKFAQGGELTSYRQWVSEVVNRYKSSPYASSILAYQLLNEAEDANAGGGPCEESRAVAALRSFTDDVGGLIHSIDPSHLVDLGTMGSGQCGERGIDYVTVHASAGPDMCDYHDYGSPSAPMPGDVWNGLQTRLVECSPAGLDKPLMVDETGIQTSSAISYEQRGSDFANKFFAQFTAGVVGELFWSLDANNPQFGTFDIGPSDPSAALMTKY